MLHAKPYTLFRSPKYGNKMPSQKCSRHILLEKMPHRERSRKDGARGGSGWVEKESIQWQYLGQKKSDAPEDTKQDFSNIAQIILKLIAN